MSDNLNVVDHDSSVKVNEADLDDEDSPSEVDVQRIPVVSHEDDHEPDNIAAECIANTTEDTDCEELNNKHDFKDDSSLPAMVGDSLVRRSQRRHKARKLSEDSPQMSASLSSKPHTNVAEEDETDENMTHDDTRSQQSADDNNSISDSNANVVTRSSQSRTKKAKSSDLQSAADNISQISNRPVSACFKVKRVKISSVIKSSKNKRLKSESRMETSRLSSRKLRSSKSSLSGHKRKKMSNRVVSNSAMLSNKYTSSANSRRPSTRRDGVSFDSDSATGKSRRHICFKGEGSNVYKAPDSVATVVTSDSVCYKGEYFAVGDIVSVTDVDDHQIYYAQLRGFLTDQYCQKSGVITWLLPLAADSVRDVNDCSWLHQANSHMTRKFDPSAYVLGYEEDIPRSLDCFTFVMHAPHDYYDRQRMAPYRVQNHLFTSSTKDLKNNALLQFERINDNTFHMSRKR